MYTCKKNDLCKIWNDYKKILSFVQKYLTTYLHCHIQKIGHILHMAHLDFVGSTVK